MPTNKFRVVPSRCTLRLPLIWRNGSPQQTSKQHCACQLRNMTIKTNYNVRTQGSNVSRSIWLSRRFRARTFTSSRPVAVMRTRGAGFELEVSNEEVERWEVGCELLWQKICAGWVGESADPTTWQYPAGSSWHWCLTAESQFKSVNQVQHQLNCNDPTTNIKPAELESKKKRIGENVCPTYLLFFCDIS